MLGELFQALAIGFFFLFIWIALLCHIWSKPPEE